MFFKSAFCCLSFKLGTLISGWLLLALSFLHLVGSSILYVELRRKIERSVDDPVIRFLHFDIPITTIFILGLVFLLYGAYKDRTGFHLPYLVAAPLQLAEFFFLQFYWFRYCTTNHLHLAYFLPGVLPFVSLQYFFCVVGGNYLDLKRRIQEKKEAFVKEDKICVV